MTALSLLAGLLALVLIAFRSRREEMFTIDVWRGIQQLPAARKDEGQSHIAMLKRLLK